MMPFVPLFNCGNYIYRRTISPENVERLMKMPDHPAIKNELFQLIEDIISKEEIPC